MVHFDDAGVAAFFHFDLSIFGNRSLHANDSRIVDLSTLGFILGPVTIFDFFSVVSGLSFKLLSMLP